MMRNTIFVLILNGDVGTIPLKCKGNRHQELRIIRFKLTFFLQKLVS